MKRDTRTMLEGCIAKLPEYMREAVRLRLLAGMTFEELSQQSGEKAGTMQARVHRAMVQIRRCMESNGWKP